MQEYEKSRSGDGWQRWLKERFRLILSNHCYLDLSHTYNNIYFSVSDRRVHRTRETSLKEERKKKERGASRQSNIYVSYPAFCLYKLYISRHVKSADSVLQYLKLGWTFVSRPTPVSFCRLPILPLLWFLPRFWK